MTLNPHQCDKCDFKTSVNNLLQEHTKGEHQKCTICNLNNFNSETLANHIREVHPDSKPVCIKCKLKFPNKIGYEVHIYKKHNKKFQCPLCNKGTSDLLKLKNHMKEKHSEKEAPAQEETITIEDVPVNHVECFICGHTDINQEELNKHMEIKHIQEVQTLKCKKCNYEANNINSMKVHETSMAHNMSSNISQCRWARQGKCMFRHEKEIAPNVEKVKECRNGEACKFKAQGRCYHYHSDVGVQNKNQKIPQVTLNPSVSQ